MTTSVPPRALQHRLAALQIANDVRTRRSLLKADIRAGTESVPTLLASPPEWLLTMKMGELVLAQPTWGHVRVARLFHKMGMSPAKTVGGISSRQRKLLIELLENSR